MTRPPKPRFDPTARDAGYLPLLPDTVENAADPDCQTCGGDAWVCENHPERVWDGVNNGPGSCGCGAGMPCACTGMQDGML